MVIFTCSNLSFQFTSNLLATRDEFEV